MKDDKEARWRHWEGEVAERRESSGGLGGTEKGEGTGGRRSGDGVDG
jgi:hypothetical protein